MTLVDRSMVLIVWNGNHVTETIQSAPPGACLMPSFTVISSVRTTVDVRQIRDGLCDREFLIIDTVAVRVGPKTPK